jgi:gluconate kinase
MGTLLVVSGPPGSGKTTVSKVLAQQFGPSALVHGDEFFSFLARDAVEPWLPEAHQQNTVVIAAAAAATSRFVAGGFFTVYDGVLGPWFMPTFGAEMGLPDFDYVVLLPTVQLCVDRVLARTGHGFRDESATRQMYAEFVQARGIERHVMKVVESDTAADLARHISAARAEGALRYVVPGASC